MKKTKILGVLSDADLKVLENTRTIMQHWHTSIASIWSESAEKKTLGNEFTGKRRKRDAKYHPKKFG